MTALKTKKTTRPSDREAKRTVVFRSSKTPSSALYGLLHDTDLFSEGISSVLHHHIDFFYQIGLCSMIMYHRYKQTVAGDSDF